jgi:hypothetical protein
MTAEQPHVEADSDALALALHRAQFVDGGTAMATWQASLDEHREQFRALARAAYEHLAGRLLPEGASARGMCGAEAGAAVSTGDRRGDRRPGGTDEQG